MSGPNGDAVAEDWPSIISVIKSRRTRWAVMWYTCERKSMHTDFWKKRKRPLYKPGRRRQDKIN
jgi:hypothetical protein